MRSRQTLMKPWSSVRSARRDNGGSAVIAGDGSSVSYTPATDFVGVETFTYVVSDGDLEDVATVTVTVAPSDNPPTAVNDAYEIAEDAATADFVVLSNDVRDVDNQEFVLDSVGVPDQGGQAAISIDGTQLTYTPALNFNGVEHVPYTIRDTGGGISVGTVIFTVTPENDVPPIVDTDVNLNRASAESTVFELTDLPANVDSGETLTVTVVSATAQGGTATVDPASPGGALHASERGVCRHGYHHLHRQRWSRVQHRYDYC